MNNTTNNNIKYTMCLACCGSGSIYNSIADQCYKCKYCKGKGKTTDIENECFLSTIQKNN